MVKKEFFPFRVLLIINLLAAIPAILFLFLQPSASRAALLFNYSERKILMAGGILLIVVCLILLDRRVAATTSDARSLFGQPVRRIIANKVLIISITFLLTLLFCETLAISIYIQQNPVNADAQLFQKGNGLIAYLLVLSFSSLVFLGAHASTLLNSLKQLSLLRAVDPDDPLKKVILPLFCASLLIGTAALLFLIQDFIPPLTAAQKLTSIISPQFLASLIWIFLGLGSACLLIWVMNVLWSIYARRVGFLARRSQPVNLALNIRPAIRKLLGLFLLIAIAAGFIFFAHPGYGTNDDYYMMAIASGKINGAPDAHLVFTNVMPGSVLARLYGWLPSVNWYSWYLTAVFLVSSTVLLKNMRNRSRDGRVYFAFAFAFCLFFLTFIWALNFTSVSILTSFAGLALLIGEAENRLEKGPTLNLACGILLIFIGGLIRLQGMLLACILVSPYLLYLLVKKKKSELALSLIVVGVLTGIGFFIDRQAYRSDPGWKFFQAYNTTRGDIYDTPRLSYSESNQDFWQAIGWGFEGYKLFTDTVFIDPQVFTLESLQKINQAFTFQQNSLATILADGMTSIKTNPALILLVITNAIFSFLILWNHKKQIYLWCGLVLWFTLVTGLLAIFQRIPDRVLLPGLLILNYGLIALFQSQNAGKIWTKNDHAVVFLYLFLVSLIALVHVLSIFTEDQNNRQNQILVNGILQEVSSVINHDPQALVVVQPGSIPLEQESSPYSLSTIPFAYLPTGWLINSPPYQDVLNAHAVGNLMHALYLNPDIYFLGTDEKDIAAYLDTKYQVKVTIHTEWSVEDHLLPFARLELVQFSTLTR